VKNAGLLAGHWHDRMIDPGDKWHPAIQLKIANAEVFLILLISAALATDYIAKHDIPKALAQQKAGKTVVVPIMLEACQFRLTKLSAHAALPEKGHPINKWNPRADGWNSAATGLENLFRKLIDAHRARV
jgi:hypothetical protein